METTTGRPSPTIGRVDPKLHRDLSVLEIKEFKVHVARIDDCIDCMLCEIRCPDFAIEVEGKDKKGKS